MVILEGMWWVCNRHERQAATEHATKIAVELETLKARCAMFQARLLEQSAAPAPQTPAAEAAKFEEKAATAETHLSFAPNKELRRKYVL